MKKVIPIVVGTSILFWGAAYVVLKDPFRSRTVSKPPILLKTEEDVRDYASETRLCKTAIVTDVFRWGNEYWRVTCLYSYGPREVYVDVFGDPGLDEG